MADGNPEISVGKPLAQPASNAPVGNGEAPGPHPATEAPAPKRPLWVWLVGGVVALLALWVAIPRVILAFQTVSTDDAYVNGHVTFVAPRVPGYVVRVLVDDNNRVHKGDLLVQLDKEPYQVKVEIAQAAVGVAQADLVSAQAKDQSLAGLAHSERYDMTHAIEDLKNQVAELHASVAACRLPRPR